MTIARIGSLLNPGGRVAIGFHARDDMTASALSRDVFRLYSTSDIQALLASGKVFKDIQILSRKGKIEPLHCALGTK